MGAVWRAYDTALEREVAIKELRVPEGAGDQERRLWYARMGREARAAARLRHPGIVTVYDRVISEDGRPWIVMELINGTSLAELLAVRGTLPERQVAAIGLAMVDALSAAHAHDIVHRDVKPANVLLEGDRTVLTDFGIAAIEGDVTLTRTGMMPGTPVYMSPEQVTGEKVTPASDLWSLGATLYAAVEGRPPFTAAHPLALFNAIVTQDPAPPRCGRPLAQVLTGLLSKDPAERPSAARVRDLLATVPAAPGSHTHRPPERQPASPAKTLPYTEVVPPGSAGADSDRRRQNVAASKHELGCTLRRLGRHSEAAPVLQEAVAIRRELAESDPGRYRPHLARSLHELGLALNRLDRHAEAAPALQEMVAIRWELAKADPERHRPYRAKSPDDFGFRSINADDPSEAVRPLQGAVTVYRKLAEVDPDHYRQDLAALLHKLAFALGEQERDAEAEPLFQEAVAIRRKLVEADPAKYRPALATALHNLGFTLKELGRYTEAVPLLQEAVAIRRKLAEANPAKYHPSLALSLHELGFILGEQGRDAEAESLLEEVVAIRRKLVEADPAKYRPALATALHNLGFTLKELGRYTEAVPLLQEAVAIRRKLAEANPARYRSSLAKSLRALGVTLEKLGRVSEAESARAEVASIRP